MAKKQITEADVKKMRDIEAYTHGGKKRSNNPPAGMGHRDKSAETTKTYSFDPHLNPTLQWAGKEEGTSFEVPTTSIHIHESIKPHKIIRSIQSIGDDYQSPQLSFFETPEERMRRKRDAIEFYKHGVDWTNRLIAGDSLIVMNSLLEKEGMAGQVQMVYIDPPYGIKYGSNFQPFVNQKEVKNTDRDDDLTLEPEMITAFRDTWELGLHSYLSYLRDRLLLARNLLADSGSVFLQISDDNVHHIRELCDEVFGADNFVGQILYQKTSGIGVAGEQSALASVGDYIVWYAKDKSNLKFRLLYKDKVFDGEGASAYKRLQLEDGRRLTIAEWEKENGVAFSYPQRPKGSRVYGLGDLTSQGTTGTEQVFYFDGKEYSPGSTNHWKTNIAGMKKLAAAHRIQATKKNINYVRFFDDFPVMPLTNIWTDTVGQNQFGGEKIYVVQSANKAIQRCMLMTTDPGDLVLDITSGSGTTAYVAEQWGRRWIACDTSRVAITLAKQRLMTATYDYYKLAQEDQGVDSGFIYKEVPHITLKSIANDEPPKTEILYDQPEIDKKRIRITGPFTVEALPAPVVKPLDDIDINIEEDESSKQADWRDQLLATGVLSRGGNRLEFSRVEPLAGTHFLQVEAETKEDNPRRAVICFAGETKPLDSRMVSMALDEVETLRPRPEIVLFAAFQFDPEASRLISDTERSDLTLLQAQMNTDLMTQDLKKKKSSDQSFWFVGQPDVELIRDGRSKQKYKVKVNGFDYYDVKKGEVKSGDASRITMWMVDPDYDGMCVEPQQVFFPMGGKKDGWNKLAKTLKAEIDPELAEKYAGTESMWFKVQPNSRIAVKIIDDRGIESMKVLEVGED